MTAGRTTPPLIPSIAAGLLMLVLLAGCAGSTSAETSSSIVRLRPTTAPETYVLQKNGVVASLIDSLSKLAALLAEPRYMDETWKSNAVNLSTAVELGYRQLEGLSPPDESQEQQAVLVAAVQDCQTLTDYVFQGINNLDKGPFDEVTQRVDLCRNNLRLATNAPGSIEQSQPVSVDVARREVHVQTKRDANLRGGPGTQYPVVATAVKSDKFTVAGRTATGDWLLVNGDRARNGWIAAFLVEADGDLQSAPVLKPPPKPAAPSPSP